MSLNKNGEMGGGKGREEEGVEEVFERACWQENLKL